MREPPSEGGEFTDTDLLERIVATDNLAAAWDRVRNGGARGGLDSVSVDDFARRSERLLAELRAAVLAEEYAPVPALRVRIPKPGKPGEFRPLGLPAVRDKILQDAARCVLEPRFERAFCDASYGYRPGRGPVRAIRRVVHLLRYEKHVFVAPLDIDDFFPSIDHRRMDTILRTHIQDDRVLRLIALWLAMGAVDGRGRWHDVEAGVPQGAVIAPLLANVYLDPFDHALRSRNVPFVRYADDILLFGHTEDAVRRDVDAARTMLASELGLHFNQASPAVVGLEGGFSFLGIRFIRDTLEIDPARLAPARERIAALSRSDAAAMQVVQAMNQTALGWRRYYGRLLPESSLHSLDAVIATGAVRLLERERRAHRVRNRREEDSFLRAVELVTEVSADRRAGLLRRLGSGTGLPGNEPPHVPGRSSPPASTTAGSRRPRSVDAAVRKVKSRYRRCLTSIILPHRRRLFLPIAYGCRASFLGS